MSNDAAALAARRFQRTLLELRGLVLQRLLEAMTPEDGAAPSAAMVSAAARFLREHADALAPSPARPNAQPAPALDGPLFDANADPDVDDDPDAVEEDAALDQDAGRL